MQSSHSHFLLKTHISRHFSIYWDWYWFYKEKLWWKNIKNDGTNIPSWDDTPPGVRYCAPFSLSLSRLLTWIGSALRAHPDVLSPNAFDHISATVNRFVPPPPEISKPLRDARPQSTKMWGPWTHSHWGHSAVKYLEKEEFMDYDRYVKV